jgi:hypothetical protein
LTALFGIRYWRHSRTGVVDVSPEGYLVGSLRLRRSAASLAVVGLLALSWPGVGVPAVCTPPGSLPTGPPGNLTFDFSFDRVEVDGNVLGPMDGTLDFVDDFDDQQGEEPSGWDVVSATEEDGHVRCHGPGLHSPGPYPMGFDASGIGTCALVDGGGDFAVDVLWLVAPLGVGHQIGLNMAGSESITLGMVNNGSAEVGFGLPAGPIVALAYGGPSGIEVLAVPFQPASLGVTVRFRIEFDDTSNMVSALVSLDGDSTFEVALGPVEYFRVPPPIPVAIQLFASRIHCISDIDGDETCDAEDVCPTVPDPAQSDTDGDAAGDACDTCAGAFNPDQRDSDGSCVQAGEDPNDCGDLCDPCPSVFPDACDTAQTVSANVDSGGGSLVTPDGMLSVNVPPNAVAGDTSLSITRRSGGSFDLGAGLREVTVADLEPSEIVFQQPVGIAFGWNNVGAGTEPFCRVDTGGTSLLREGKLRVYRNGVEMTAQCGEGLTPLACPEQAQCGLCMAPPCVEACCDPGPVGMPGGNTFTVDVTEFSEYAVVAPCALVEKPRIVVSNLDTPPGDDGLTVKGEITLPVPFTPALDPVTDGVRLVIDDAAGTLLDLTIPGGSVDETGVGWKTNRAVPPTKWTYVNGTVTPPAGIRRVVIRDRSVSAPGLVKFVVKGKSGDYSPYATNPPLSGVLDLGVVECGVLAFPGEPGPTCGPSSSGRAFKCS